jgi:hypothetical protein
MTADKTNECLYPPCPKCNKGYLLPFYNEFGVNIYLCTMCTFRIGHKSKGGHRGVIDPDFEPDSTTQLIWDMEKMEEEQQKSKKKKSSKQAADSSIFKIT